MTLLIALLWGAVVFSIGYFLVYRVQAFKAQVQKNVNDAYEQPTVVVTIDRASPEYKLAQAGIRTQSPQFTWLVLHWIVPLVAAGVALAAGFPVTVALAAAFIGYVAPRQWIESRIRDRGRRADEEIPLAYARLLSILRAAPEVGSALTEVANMIELEKGAPTILSSEFRLTAEEIANKSIGRAQALRNLQQRAPSVSVGNLGLLLERFSSASGDQFFGAFEAAAGNMQNILGARSRAYAKAAEQLGAARAIPVLAALAMLGFMSDPGFAASFQMPLVQLALGGVAVLMFLGNLIMSDIVREAV